MNDRQSPSRADEHRPPWPCSTTSPVRPPHPDPEGWHPDHPGCSRASGPEDDGRARHVPDEVIGQRPARSLNWVSSMKLSDRFGLTSGAAITLIGGLGVRND